MNWAQLLGGMGTMGGMGPGGAGVPPAQDSEQRYAVQLQQLHDMGFQNRAVNVRVLQQTGGNVEAAVERLLMG